MLDAVDCGISRKEVVRTFGTAMPMALTRHHGYPNVGSERFSGLIHHADRVVQYTSLSFGRRLEEAGLFPRWAG